MAARSPEPARLNTAREQRESAKVGRGLGGASFVVRCRKSDPLWSKKKPSGLPPGHCPGCRVKLPKPPGVPERVRPFVCDPCARTTALMLRCGAHGPTYPPQRAAASEPSPGATERTRVVGVSDSEGRGGLAPVAGCGAEPHEYLSGRAIRVLRERGDQPCDDCGERDAIEEQSGIDALPGTFAMLRRRAADLEAARSVDRAEPLGKNADNATPYGSIESVQGDLW